MDGCAASSQGGGLFGAPVSPRRQGRLPERSAAGDGVSARRLRTLHRPQAAAESARCIGAAHFPRGVYLLMLRISPLSKPPSLCSPPSQAGERAIVKGINL